MSEQAICSHGVSSADLCRICEVEELKTARRKLWDEADELKAELTRVKAELATARDNVWQMFHDAGCPAGIRQSDFLQSLVKRIAKLEAERDSLARLIDLRRAKNGLQIDLERTKRDLQAANQRADDAVALLKRYTQGVVRGDAAMKDIYLPALDLLQQEAER